MSLTGLQIGRIHKAILAAYTRDELERVLLTCMDVDFDHVVARTDFSAQVFALVRWANNHDRALELLKYVHEENPTNSGLAKLHAEAQGWGTSASEASLAAPPPPTGPHQIFLSYSHKDSEIKDRLLADLAEGGLSVWTDDGLEAGTVEWKRAIKQAILDAKCLVAILSPNAEQSKWVNIEIDFALEWNCPILPVLAHGERRDAVPLSLFGVQYVDVRTDHAGQVKGKLLPALRKHLGAPVAPPLTPAQEAPPPMPPKRNTVNAQESVRVEVLPPALPMSPAVAPALIALMQDNTVPADKRLMAGLRAADLGDLPLDLDAFIAIPGQSFRIGKYPVTNAQFKRFMDAGGYKLENEKHWWSTGGVEHKHHNGWSEPRFWRDHRFNRPVQPVVAVSWYEAEAYCHWLNDARFGLHKGDRVRLPTLSEWETAARGGRPKPADDAHDYPWRGPFRPDLANSEESNLRQTTPVHMYLDGATPQGVFDLLGNVWEWTQDVYKGVADAYWLVGRAWNLPAQPISAARRTLSARRYWFGDLGFRVLAVPALS